MKLLKYFVTLLVVLLMLLIGTMVTLLLTVDPNEYKPQIVQAVQEATGRELRIPGDLSLSVFPWIGLKLGETELSNAPGFKGRYFLRLEGVDIKIAFMPLLKGKVQIGVIRLNGLNAHLMRNKQGVNNWDDLLAHTKDRGGSQSPEPLVPSKSDIQTDIALTSILLGGVEIEDANVRWQDALEQMDVKLEAFNLSTGEIQLGKPIEFQSEFKLSSNAPSIHAALSVTGKVAMDESFEKLTLDRFQWQTDIAQSEFADAVISLQGSSDVTLDLPQQIYRLKQLDITLNAKGDDIPAGEQTVYIKSNVEINLNTQFAKLQALQLRALDLTLESEITASQILAEPKMQGHMKLAPFSPKSIMNTLGETLPPTADPNVLNKIDFESNFEGDLNAIRLSELNMVLDQTQVNGEVTINNLSQSPHFDVALHMDEIDLDRYLPPALDKSNQGEGERATQDTRSSESVEGSIEQTATGDERIELPVEMMRELNANGRLIIGKLKMMNIKASQFDAGVKAQSGLIHFNPMLVHLYKGNYKGSAVIDVRQEVPRYSMNIDLDAVESGSLLEDYMGKRKIEGNLSAAANITTYGETVNELMRSINGDYDFKFINGALSMNVRERLNAKKAELKQRLSGEEVQISPPSKEPTKFSSITASGTLKNGVVHNQNLEMKARYLYVTGIGQYALPNEYIDYIFTLLISRDKAGQEDSLTDIYDFPFDFHLKGKLSELDYAEISKDAFTNALKGKTRLRVEREKEAARAQLEAQKAKARAELEAKKEAERKALEAKKAEARQKLEEAKQKEREALERKKAEEKAELEEKKKAKEEELKKKLEEKKKELLDRFKG